MRGVFQGDVIRIKMPVCQRRKRNSLSGCDVCSSFTSLCLSIEGAQSIILRVSLAEPGSLCLKIAALMWYAISLWESSY